MASASRCRRRRAWPLAPARWRPRRPPPPPDRLLVGPGAPGVRFIGTPVPCWYARCLMPSPMVNARTPADLPSRPRPARFRPCRRSRAPERPMGAGCVLEAFAESGEWGIRDLFARRTSLAARIRTFATWQLWPARSGRRAGRFRVGADLAGIGLLVAEHLDIRRVGRPHRARLGGHRRDRRDRRLRPQRRQFSAVDAVETSHPIRYLWNRSGLERPPPRLSGKGILPSCRPTSRTPSSTGCPIKFPDAPR
jgi:hypothetical protein